MPTGNLRNHAVTVEVPPELAEVFCEEAHRTLHYAADSLEETLRWDAEGKRPATPEQIAHQREAVRLASEILDQTYVAEASMKVEGDRAAIASTLQGCLLDASDELKGECEPPADAENRAIVRARLAQVETVLSLMDSVEGQAS